LTIVIGVQGKERFAGIAAIRNWGKTVCINTCTTGKSETIFAGKTGSCLVIIGCTEW
jgi:hypothetical protein